MHSNPIKQRFFYQNKFVICRLIEFNEESHFFTAAMESEKNYYTQRFIESGAGWMVVYKEDFFVENDFKMLPQEISTQLLKHLDEHYPIKHS